MTDILVEFIKVEEILPIKDADRIVMIPIGGYQTIVRKDDFQIGDIGLFISIDSIIPDSLLGLYNLDIKNGRIKTKKLRGVYSQGLLLPLKVDLLALVKEGSTLKEIFGITKYEATIPKAKIFGGLKPTKWPSQNMWVYDLESLQNPHFRDVFSKEDDVIVTEKVHGRHGTACFIEGKFYFTSRKVSLEVPAEEDKIDNIYWNVVKKYELEDRVKDLSEHYRNKDIILRYEIYGKGIQDLEYGLDDVQICLFDIEVGIGYYLNNDEISKFGLPTPPVLYKGKFDLKKIEEIANQDSKISKKKGHICEGVVIKDVEERNLRGASRRILKEISKRYAEKGQEISVDM